MKKLFSKIICMAFLLTLFIVPSARASSDYPENGVTPIHTDMLEATNLGDEVLLMIAI